MPNIKIPSKNIYKSFRNVPSGNNLVERGKKWDEPTYLTFSVFFKMGDSEKWRNQTIITNYDRFPHPLLNLYQEDNYDARNEYSTIQFLRDNNETIREEMLRRFIDDLDSLQTYYPWYFQSIAGINTLLNVKPDRGRRASQESKLTFTTLEGIDQKMSTILNLYKKIAWDDTYQRWMLPDMMRNFVMEIYVTEFRTFHESRIKEQLGVVPKKERTFFGNVANYLYTNVPVVNNLVNAIKPSTVPAAVDLVLDAIHKTMPTLKITCERCEFDITSINKQMDSYSVGELPNMEAITFDIKVGQVTEEYINPILDYFFSDNVINGKDRSISQEGGVPVTGEGTVPGQVTPPINLAENSIKTSSNKGRHALNNPDIAQREANSDLTHISGTSFNEMQNDKKGIYRRLGSDGTTPSTSTFVPPIDANIPNTWTGNAKKFGIASLENFAQSKIAKASMTKIPGLGLSLNEAIGAIESKDFISVFGLIAGAIKKTQKTPGPSKLLNREIYESTVKQYLTTVVLSEATDGDSLELQNFASSALQDRSILAKILDYSQATDLTSKSLGEINLPNAIRDANKQYNIYIEQQSQSDRSRATDLDGNTNNLNPTPIIYEGLPSTATSTPIQTG